ncbi:putative receptor protein kinase ZmPK1 [Tanacetum coccineum]
MGVDNSVFIKVPKSLVPSYNDNFTICPRQVVTPIIRSYDDKRDNKQLGLLLVFGCLIGFVEIICIVSFWYYTSKRSSITEQNFQPVTTGFRKFTYSELKKASHNFSEEIGRGGACVVYKGMLSDNRIAAIKRLNNTNNQGEAEFQAENGSLVHNMGIGKLDWATRFSIATGTAKGLAYLHEDCLEWVLHCDVKPHNILLDANCIPKVADFGLSKLFDRCDSDQWNFSVMRGTRGYMAPKWEGVPHACIKQTTEIVDKIVDPSISSEYDRSTMENLVKIALQCAEEDREARPSTSQVVDGRIHVHHSGGNCPQRILQ